MRYVNAERQFEYFSLIILDSRSFYTPLFLLFNTGRRYGAKSNKLQVRGQCRPVPVRTAVEVKGCGFIYLHLIGCHGHCFSSSSVTNIFKRESLLAKYESCRPTKEHLVHFTIQCPNKQKQNSRHAPKYVIKIFPVASACQCLP